jgi:hypothetical protein
VSHPKRTRYAAKHGRRGGRTPGSFPALAGHDEPNGSGGGSLVAVRDVVRFGVAWTETGRYTDVTFRRITGRYRISLGCRLSV